MTGDGKTALRASWGIFYNFPRSTGDGGYPFSGGCPVSCTRQIRWARFGDITAATPPNLIENPVNVTAGGYEQPLAKSHNVNVAFQRDIGFNTVAEIAWVGNYTWNHGRFVDDNRLPLYVYADPNNLVNNAPVAANSLRYQYGKYPGMGSVNVYVPALYAKTLQYNAMQMQLQRRLTNGLQMGFAYTLAKGEGYTGYDPYTDQIGGEAAIHARYWGPTTDDRRHNISATWSYDVPTWTEMPVIKQLLMDWQVSGIFRMLSGQAITPTCSSNTAGINNSQPDVDRRRPAAPAASSPASRSSAATRCDTSLPEADRLHFNLAAFRMPQPNGSIGNFGNSAGRHPASPDVARVGPHAVAPLPDQPGGTEEQRRPAALRGLQRVQRGAVHQHERVVHVHHPGGRAAEFVEHQRQHRQVHGDAARPSRPARSRRGSSR